MDIINTISVYAVPVSIAGILIFGLLKNINVYSVFLDGAKEGLKIGVGIIPPILGLLAALGMFRASGALELIINSIRPLTDFFKIPPEIVPFALMRPVSGGASLAMATDIFQNYGVDSFAGRAAAVMMGSTETTFYTLAVYFGATKASNTRHTLRCALTADVVGIILSVWVCRCFFA
ncbi:MAG: spore maturation protein [Clostridia bacterium]|nr:spore maturation protein [Clostridia bacterium]